MKGKRLIEKIKLRNILSFGDQGEEIELQPLNIIIGQNASGKSNLVDVIKLLREIWRGNSIASFISKNGGINEWLWKGNKTDNFALVNTKIFSKVEEEVTEYEFSFNSGLFEEQATFIDEIIINTSYKKKATKKQVQSQDAIGRLTSDESVFSKYHNIHINDFGFEFITFKYVVSELRAYSDLQTNRNAEIRRPQVADAPNEFLEEDASNLSLVLNDLERRGHTKDIIIENLRKFYPRIKDYSLGILGGTVQLFIREEGLEKPISAMRLSDGTLRYLCLLAILCHPEPPPLICIEEPETGLHPDILPTIAELMKDAAQRTQLIVTTHSDILVSAFSDMPEAVMVCEKDEDGTHFKRLEAEKLKEWLEEYELGDLWIKGEIGGKRW
jgi:predicted ATPase